MPRLTFACTPAVLLLLTASAFAAEPAKRVYLWPEGAPAAKGQDELDRPSLTIHLPPADKATGTGVIVCPGGGYHVLAIDHEGQQTAKWLNSVGVAAFVLKYRLKPKYEPVTALLDGQRAVRYLRQNAKEYGVSPNRVGMLGFSAGGHLTASVGITHDAGDPSSKDPVDRQSSRPDFMVLVYGGATSVGDGASAKGFSAGTPPAFVITTSEDGSADKHVACFLALREAKVPAELHVYGGYGPHGTGMAPGDPALGNWPTALQAWMRKGNLLTTAERAKVTGRVTIKGAPLHRGWVTFVSLDNPNAPSPAHYIAHKADGKFTFDSTTGPVPGKYRVEVRQVATALEGEPSVEDVTLYPDNVRAEIKPGENMVDIAVKGE